MLKIYATTDYYYIVRSGLEWVIKCIIYVYILKVEMLLLKQLVGKQTNALYYFNQNCKLEKLSCSLFIIFLTTQRPFYQKKQTNVYLKSNYILTKENG